ncbi:phage major capsid protein [Micromonospora musae]|uniref:phage major capsid protein n=1 Tax=Micromonospora musae TaxID=1894970 RepID=UPI0033F0EC04
MPYNDVSTSNPDLLPIEYSSQVIKEMTEQSAVLGLSRRLTMSTRQTRMPAVSALARAYWVNGETGLKQTTKNEWTGVNLIVEELAALVPIPHAHMDDSNFPVWDETRPAVVEAMGAALDAAVLFGVNKPATWPTPIYQTAYAAGNNILSTYGDDFAVAVAEGARRLKANDGYSVTGFASEPGLQWELVQMRSGDGAPIYQTNLSGPITTGLYGRPLQEVGNGAWDSDEAKLIFGDWSKSMVGIRQDITFTRHESGIINDDSGNVVFNAMQQDSTIWRAVFRVAWAVARPQTRIAQSAGLTTTQRFPFGVVVNSSTYDYS